MILPDVNVLVYAFREDTIYHERCREWLESIVNGGSAYGASPQVLSSFLRITTHVGIFAQPSPAGRGDSVLSSWNSRTVSLFSQSIATGLLLPISASVFKRLATFSGDAWFAALEIGNGCEWITTDRDYSLFPELRWQPPS